MKLRPTRIDGRWAVCQAGRLFKVIGKVDDSFVGKGLDGQPRQSRVPAIVHPEDGERLDKLAASMDLHKGGQTG